MSVTLLDKRLVAEVLLGLTCLHRRMQCPSRCGNPRCRHFYCPDCGLSWDDDIPFTR